MDICNTYPFFNYYGGEHWAYINNWYQVYSHNYIFISELDCIVYEIYPLLPSQIRKLINIRSLAIHDCLGHLTVKHIYVVSNIRYDIGFEFQTVVPHFLRRCFLDNFIKCNFLLRQLVSMGPAMPLRQWMQPARPRSYSVKIYIYKIDHIGNYESIFP